MKLDEETLCDTLKTNLELTKKLDTTLKNYWIINLLAVYLFVVISIIFLRSMGLI